MQSIGAAGTLPGTANGNSRKVDVPRHRPSARFVWRLVAGLLILFWAVVAVWQVGRAVRLGLLPVEEPAFAAAPAKPKGHACTGDPTCKVCKSCHGCRWCAAGGTCGVKKRLEDEAKKKPAKPHARER